MWLASSRTGYWAGAFPSHFLQGWRFRQGMLLKDVVRSKVCGVGEPSGFSLRRFIRWAAMLDKSLLLKLLDALQIELDEEERNLREVAELVRCANLHHELRQQWCLRCAQLRAYYRRREGANLIRYRKGQQE